MLLLISRHYSCDAQLAALNEVELKVVPSQPQRLNEPARDREQERDQVSKCVHIMASSVELSHIFQSNFCLKYHTNYLTN
jgi:hypothetical protein